MHDDDLDRVVQRSQELLERIEQEADEPLRRTIFELLQHVDTLHREGLSRLRAMLRAAGQGQLLEKAAADPAVALLLELYDLQPRGSAPRHPEGDEGAGRHEGAGRDAGAFVPLETLGLGPAAEPSRATAEEAPAAAGDATPTAGDAAPTAGDTTPTAGNAAPTAGHVPDSRPEEASPEPEGFRAVVAGVGNELRGDDGFGLAVLRRLSQRELPEGVELEEVGIGGIHLVQRLMAHGYDGLVIVDAVDRRGTPGQLYELETDVPDPVAGEDERLTEVDLHQTDPSRVLLMARAIGALPPRVRIVGCQPGRTELSESLSDPVRQAVEPAADRVALLLEEWSREYTDAVDPPPGSVPETTEEIR